MTASLPKYVTKAPPPPPAARASGGRIAEVPFRRLSNIRSAAQRRIQDIAAIVADNDSAGFMVPIDNLAYAVAQTRMAVSSGFAFKAVMAERVDRETGEVIRKPVRTKDGKRLYRPYRFLGADDDVRKLVLADLENMGRPHEYCAATDAVIHVARENEARRSSGMISGDAIAAIFQVTLAQRDRLRLSTFGAVDVPKPVRQAKAAERKRGSDRVKIQAKRLERKPSTRPREVYESTSAETLKPWLVEGVSRRTWYRQKAARGTADTVAQVCRDGFPSGKEYAATYLCQSRTVEAPARPASPSARAGNDRKAPPPRPQTAAALEPDPAPVEKRRRRPPRTDALRPKSSMMQMEFWPQLISSAGATAPARLRMEPKPDRSRPLENRDLRDLSVSTDMCQEAAP